VKKIHQEIWELRMVHNKVASSFMAHSVQPHKHSAQVLQRNYTTISQKCLIKMTKL